MSPGTKVTLRKDRAEAYGEPVGRVYTVLRTRPHPHYKRTWVEIVEWEAPTNVVDSKELRFACAVKRKSQP